MKAARAPRAKLRRRLAVGGAVFCLIAVLVAALYVVAWSPVFMISTVEVDGTKVLRAGDVKDAAGAAVGTSLVLADVPGMATRVAGLPPVAEVTVTREWPDTVRIAVTERKARLSVAWGSQYLIADASGVVFNVMSSAPSGLIPVVVDPANRQLIADTGTVYSALSPDVQKQVRQIRADTRDSITIELTSGRRVIWGSVDQSELKSQVLDVLLTRKDSVIDVSAPSNPTTR